MLPESRLDDDLFEELIEQYKTDIQGIYPEWTDFNYHDPGITMLELFVFMKQNQQFFMEQLSDSHFEEFVRLLVTECKGISPTIVSAKMKDPYQYEEVFVKRGTRFVGGGYPFEGMNDTMIPFSDIVKIGNITC